MTSPIAPLPGMSATAATAAPSTATAGGSQTLGKDAFLKLLVAQLKYQNPMSPADSTQFVTQSAQFTMVEKLEELANQATEQLSLERSILSTSLLGRTVTASAKDGPITGVVSSIRMDPTDGLQLKIGTTEVPLSAVQQLTTGSAG